MAAVNDDLMAVNLRTLEASSRASSTAGSSRGKCIAIINNDENRFYRLSSERKGVTVRRYVFFELKTVSNI